MKDSSSWRLAFQVTAAAANVLLKNPREVMNVVFPVLGCTL
jgi:hypothetical protein